MLTLLYMAKNNSFRVCSAVSRSHKAKRGGNKDLINTLESQRYNNAALLRNCMTLHNNNKLTKTIMSTKNLLDSALGRSVVRGVRSGMFANFCASLVDSLASSSSEGAGVGRLSYAALVCAWRKDTANCGFSLNETEGKRLFNADNNDSRVKRVGVEGHWAWLVSPSAGSASSADSDSLSVVLGAWLRSWSAWYEAVVQYGHYGANGVPSGSCVSAALLARISGLWSVRGRGGRVAASTSEKAGKKATAQLEVMTEDAKLALAAAALGVSVDILRALKGGASLAPAPTNE